MPVQSKPNIPDDKQDPKAVSATSSVRTAGDDVGVEPVGTRTGKEQDAIYKEEGQLLAEVKEKYKDADLEAQKQVEQAIGTEAKARAEIKLSPEISEAGVKSNEEEASNVIAKGSTLELPVTQDAYESGRKAGFGGKRLVNRNIVGVSSLAALAIMIGRLLKMAHKHARKVIFRKSGSEQEKSAEGGDNAG